MSRVTAFVTTIGASTFERCLRALGQQAYPPIIDIIVNLPWADAQNEMIARCQTELLVQVDEDMILYPDAIARMALLIDAAEPACVMAASPLWDVDIGMEIYGTKIYRHELLRRVPFVPHVLGDTHDRERWAADGMTWTRAKRTRANCVGEHGTFYTPEEAFKRWRGMWQRHRRTGKAPWIEPWVAKLRARYEESRSRLDLFAMLGAITGATEEPWPDDAGPDFTRPNPVLDRLRTLIP